MSDGMVEEPSLPERPSLRGRVLTRIVRLFVKHWPRGDYRSLVRQARLLLELPAWLSFPLSYGVSCKKIQGTEICGEWIIPNSNYYDDRVLLYLHGGGYVSCNPQTHRPITATLARLLHWRVFALDYRLAPEAPFPPQWMTLLALLTGLLNKVSSRTRLQLLEIPPEAAW